MSGVQGCRLIAFVLMAGFVGASDAGAGTISGRVTCAGAPCAEVDVVVYDLDSQFVEFSWTNASGDYSVGGLAAGSYKVRFNGYSAGFGTAWFRDRATFELADAVVVTASGVTGGISGNLPRLGSISGRVTGDGAPLTNVSVQAYDAFDQVRPRAEARTGGDGTYSLPGLPAGSYKVSFGPSGQDFVGQWYLDRPNFALAEAVRVDNSANRGGIDAALHRAGAIAGRVSSGGAPLPGVYVAVVTLDPELFWEAVTDTGGRYAVRGLASGVYRVSFRKDGYLVGGGDGSDPEVDGVVPLTAPETVEVDADLTLAASIAGKVSAAGAPCAGVRVAAYRDGTQAGSAWSEADGTYVIRGLRTGTYTVYFAEGQCGENLAQWYPAAYQREEAGKVTLAAPGEAGGIDADLVRGGSISGLVTGGGGPLSGIEVTVRRTAGGHVGSVLTGADGRYSVGWLPPGEYRVHFAGNGIHLGEWHADRSVEAEAVPVAVVVGRDTPGVDADLARGGSISGTVTSGGAPLVASVYALRDGTTMRSGTSTANGAYTLSGLPTGTYKVLFSTATSGALHRAEWYDDQPDADHAQAVAVTAPASTTGVDADLTLKGGIAGTVRSGGAPLAGTTVSACDATGKVVLWTTSATDGTYRIRGLDAGSYRVSFTPRRPHIAEWYDDQPALEAAQPVLVANAAQTAGVDADLARGGSISGTTSADGVPVAGTSVVAYAPDGTAVGSARTGAGGTYSITGLPPGSCRVGFFPDAPYVQEWYRDQPSRETADPVAVAVGTDTPGIDAALGREGSISGVVTAGGAPLADVWVEACPIGEWTHCWSGKSGYNGRYRVGRLPSGSYEVHFMPSSRFLREWYDDRLDRADAVRVVVTAPNESGGINADLGRGGTMSGRVTFRGAPVGGLEVQMHRASAEDMMRSVWTDDGGYYQFEVIYPGDYKVRFLGDELSLANEWYPGQGSHGAAQPLHVTASSALTGIDAALARGGSICGSAAPDVTVQVFSSAGELRDSMACWGDGTFCFEGLPSGTYKLKRVDAGIDTWYGNRQQFADAREIGVAAPLATTGIDIPPWTANNSAPVLDPIGVTVVQIGSTLRLSVTAWDLDGDALAYGVEGLPAGATFEPAAGSLVWTPGPDQVGWHRVTFRVADDGSPPLSDSVGVSIAVTRGGWPPRLDPVGDRSGLEGKFLRFTLSGYDAGGDPLTFSASGLPEGAVLSPSTGAFVWRPRYDESGIYPVTFTVSDNQEPAGTDSEDVVLAIGQPTGAIFRDVFTHATSADPAWRVLAGSWAVSRGLYGSRSLSQVNVARVLRFDPAAFPLRAGVIQAKVRLTAAAASRPTAALAFSLKDARNYRYVRLLPGRVEIGQAGRLGGEMAGVRKVFPRQVSVERQYTLTVRCYAGGLVTVLLDGRIVGSHRFRQAVPGGVGLAAAKARSFFDDFTVWDDAALYH